MPGRISLVTFLHLTTNEPPEDRALSLTAILADAINLGLAKMAEGCPEQASPPAWSWPGTFRAATYSQTLAELVNFADRGETSRLDCGF